MTEEVGSMKKILSLVLVLAMALSLVACGDKTGSDEPVINDEVQMEQDTREDSGDIDEEEIYSNKIYCVGDDIPEGTYVISCTKSEFGMDVVVFKSETEYKAFQNADQFTVGEYNTAIEQHAWVDFYIKEGETAYIGLESGNIILLDDGMCEFGKYDTLNSNVLHSGIYVVGKDISAGNLDIKCTTDYLQVVVFENSEKYTEYHKTSRFSVGEESDAIEAYSASSDFVYKDDTTSVNLQDGMILMLDDGTGEYSVDSGPVIN